MAKFCSLNKVSLQNLDKIGMKKINLMIVTPERVVYQNEVDEITASTESGVIGILPEHAPLVSIVKTGEFSVKKDGEILPLAVAGGILEVRSGSRVVVLADYSEFAREIDLKRAEEAYARARELMEKKAEIEDVDFARFQSMIEKELNRVKIASKHQKKKFV